MRFTIILALVAMLSIPVFPQDTNWPASTTEDALNYLYQRINAMDGTRMDPAPWVGGPYAAIGTNWMTVGLYIKTNASAYMTIITNLYVEGQAGVTRSGREATITVSNQVTLAAIEAAGGISAVTATGIAQAVIAPYTNAIAISIDSGTATGIAQAVLAPYTNDIAASIDSGTATGIAEAVIAPYTNAIATSINAGSATGIAEAVVAPYTNSIAGALQHTNEITSLTPIVFTSDGKIGTLSLVKRTGAGLLFDLKSNGEVIGTFADTNHPLWSYSPAFMAWQGYHTFSGYPVALSAGYRFSASTNGFVIDGHVASGFADVASSNKTVSPKAVSDMIGVHSESVSSHGAFPITVTYSGTNILLNAATNRVFRITLTNNAHLNMPTNLTDGGYVEMWIKQGTGSNALSLASGYVLPTGTTNLSLSTISNSVDCLIGKYDLPDGKFRFTGLNLYGE